VLQPYAHQNVFKSLSNCNGKLLSWRLALVGPCSLFSSCTFSIFVGQIPSLPSDDTQQYQSSERSSRYWLIPASGLASEFEIYIRLTLIGTLTFVEMRVFCDLHLIRCMAKNRKLEQNT